MALKFVQNDVLFNNEVEILKKLRGEHVVGLAGIHLKSEVQVSNYYSK